MYRINRPCVARAGKSVDARRRGDDGSESEMVVGVFGALHWSSAVVVVVDRFEIRFDVCEPTACLLSPPSLLVVPTTHSLRSAEHSSHAGRRNTQNNNADSNARTTYARTHQLPRARPSCTACLPSKAASRPLTWHPPRRRSSPKIPRTWRHTAVHARNATHRNVRTHHEVTPEKLRRGTRITRARTLRTHARSHARNYIYAPEKKTQHAQHTHTQSSSCTAKKQQQRRRRRRRNSQQHLNRARTLARSHARTLARTLARTHARTHARTRAHTHAPTHPRSYARTHALGLESR